MLSASPNQSSLCPIKVLKRLFSLAGLPPSPEEHVFTKISRSTSSLVKPIWGTTLSYTKARELFISALRDVNVQNISDFSLHSLRSGGATHAANSGADAVLIKKHGRWAREQSRDGYIVDSLSRELSVTQSMLSAKGS